MVELAGRKKDLKAKMRPARYLSFYKQEDELLQYLKAKPEGERLDLAIYRQCFAGIRNSSRCQPLSEAERCGLAWVIAVGVELPHYGLKDLEKVVKSACALRAEEGEGRLVDFCGAPSWKEPVSLRDCARALDLLTTFFENGEQWSEVDHLFDQFYNGKHSLEDLVEALVKMQVVDEKLHLRDASAVKKLLEGLHKEDFPLTDKQIEQLGEFYERVDEYYRKWADCSMAEWVRMASQIRTESDGIDTDKTLQLVAIAKHVMRIQFKITLHPTQICTVLGKLLSGNRTGCLAQVKTGEGKSYIVTLLAFVLSMQNLGVHIVSSNQGLAKRDQQDGFSFFGRFGISTGHICVNFPEASRFLPDILYGTATDFEFAIMRELLDGCSLFSESLGREKRFDCVIVDEVDNLTIDTMLNKARLSQMAEESYEWVYEPIWRFMQGEAVDKSVKALRIFLEGYRKGCFRGKVPSLTDKQLMNWMLNAVKAGKRRRKTDYIIKPGEDGRLRIVIVDVNNTGELMESCRWGGGLEFKIRNSC